MSLETFVESLKAKNDASDNLNRSLATAVTQNPDELAKYKRLADATGYDPELIRQSDIFKEDAQNKVNRAGLDAFVSTHPQAARVLANPEIAGMMYDDTDNASMVYDAVSGLNRPKPTTASYLNSIVTSFYESFRQGYYGVRAGVAKSMQESVQRTIYQAGELRPQLTYDASLGRLVPTGKMEPTTERAANLLQNVQQNVLGPEILGYAKSTKRVLEETPVFQTKLAEWTQQGVSSLAQSIPGVLATAISPALGATYFSTQTGAPAMGKYLERGGTLDQALLGASIEGVTEGSLNAIPMSFVVNKFGNTGFKQFVGGLIGREVPTELATTFVQTATDTAIANPNKTWAQWRNELPENIAQTLVGVAVSAGAFGGIHATAHLHEHIAVGNLKRKEEQAQQAEHTFNALSTLSQAASESKLRGRSKEHFNDFVKNMSEGDDGVTTLYLDAAKLQEAVAAAPDEGVKLFQDMPALQSQYAEALATNGMVAIPTADYATHIAGGAVDQTILPHLRIAEDGMTYAEAQSHYAQQSIELADAAAKIAQARIEDTAYQEDVQKVHDLIKQDLEASGRFTASANNMYATLTKNFFVTQAERMGMKPSELFDQYRLKTQGVAPLATEQTFKEATPDRRKEQPARKAIVDMTKKELQKALLEHELTGIPNKRAYEDSAKLPLQASIDVDSLKWINDNMGHEAGNALLKAAAHSLTQHSSNAFHISGDEFYVQGNNEAELHDALKKAQETMAGIDITYVAPDGTRTKVNGGFSYGIANTIAEADHILGRDKTRREQQGLRAERGTVPPGATRTTAEGRPLGIQAAPVTTGKPINEMTEDELRQEVARLRAAAPGQRTEPVVLTKEQAQPATLRKGEVSNLLSKTDWAVTTAENPAAQQLTPEENAQRMRELENQLNAQNIQFEKIKGKYGGNEENSVILYGVPRDKALTIAAKFNQESVLTRDGLLYPDGTVSPARSVSELAAKPEDNYRVAPDGTMFAVDINFEQRLELPEGTNRIGEVSVTGTHFSSKPRSVLSGQKYGTGLKGAEAKRLSDPEADPRIKQRVSFYVDEGKGVFPEAGVGAARHEVQLNNMYDGANNPLRLSAGSFNDFEKAVLDAGYQGYYIKEGFGRQGVAVVMGDSAYAIDTTNRAYEQSAVPDSTVETTKALARADEIANGVPPLQGLPRASVRLNGELYIPGPFGKAHQVAAKYMSEAGMAYNPPVSYVTVTTEKAVRVALAYENMKHDPQNPEVKAAYEQLIKETSAQYQAIIDSGLQIEFIDFAKTGDPYAGNPRGFVKDIIDNNHMWVFSTRDGFGTDEAFDPANNPLLAATEFKISGQPALANDLFRVVHDYFGHALDGVGFRASGEENAYRAHAAMFSPLARRALASETRGQNSWLNFGPHGEKNRTALSADTIFADQKTGLMPEWASEIVEPQQADQTQTEAFRKWFGNSKVVDEKGNPLVVYHGTQNLFNTFKDKEQRQGFYFTDEAGYASLFTEKTGILMQVYLAISNPAILKHGTPPALFKKLKKAGYPRLADLKDYLPDEYWNLFDGDAELSTLLKTLGYDGVLLKEPAHQGSHPSSWLAFDPEQIKSATGNRGTFDPTSPNILYQSQPLFFSALGRAIPELRNIANKQGEVKAEQAQAWVDARQKEGKFKKAEVEATGLSDYLKLKDKHSVVDIVQFVNDNGVQVTETTLGKPGRGTIQKTNSKYDVVGEDGTVYGTYTDMRDAEDGLKRANAPKKTKFEPYVQPGGENYRELLLTLPEKGASDLNTLAQSMYGKNFSSLDDGEANKVATAENKEKKANNFKSSHFEQKNILAHIRFNERTDANGNRVLFLEELQSDWGQKGKKEGFGETQTYKIIKTDGNLLRDGFGTEDAAAKYLATVVAEGWGKSEWVVAKSKKLEAAVPSAPFVTDTKAWTALALKRMIRYAADNGFDKIAWTTGEQQAARYDLSKQIAEIDSIPNGDGKYDLQLTMPDGSTRMTQGILEKDLEDNVGKELAKKIIEAGNLYTAANKAYRNAVKQFGSDAPSESELNKLREAKDTALANTNFSGLDLKIGGEGMKGYYDKIVPQVANDVLKKLGGDKVEGVEIVTGDAKYAGMFENYPAGGEESNAGPFKTLAEAEKNKVNPTDIVKQVGQQEQQGFTITDEMRASISQGLPLFQGESVNRGAFNPDTLTISLLKDADLSTYLHELGHFFLETSMDMASRADAPQDIKDDMTRTLKWFGVKDINTWNGMSMEAKRQYHEQFARGFEAYLYEGKAPTLEQQKMFSRFKSWLIEVYKSIAALNVQLNDEVRGVFDRMIASEEEIKMAEETRGYGSLFANAEDAKMSPEAFAEYQALGKDASNQAATAIERRSIRDMRWLSNAKTAKMRELQAEAKSKRKAIREEVAAEVMAEPINKARAFLKSGETTDPETGDQIKIEKGFKLNKEVLAEMYPETMNARPDLSKLRGLTMENGLHPDTVADMFGLQSGEALVRELIDGEKAKDKIDGLTDKRMLEENGELIDQPSIEKAAEAAIHNDARARFLATGLLALTKNPLPVSQVVKAAREVANQVINAKKIRDLYPSRYTAAETKANKDALKKVAKDPAGAQAAQRAALLNNQLAKAALEAQEEVRKGVDHMNRVQKKAAQANMRGEYLTQMNALLDRFDLRKSTTLKAIDTQRTPLAEWLTAESDRLSAVMPDIPAWVLNEGNSTSYKTLTMEEFRGVLDTVKSLENLARREEKQYQAIRGMLFDEEKKAILDRLREYNPESFTLDGEPKGMSPKFVKTTGDAIKELGDKFAGEFLNAETIINMLEGGNMGQVHESLFGRMSHRTDWKATKLSELYKELAPLFANYSLKERYDFSRKDISSGKNIPGLNEALTRENALVIALLHGSEDGQQRLANYGWSPETQKQIAELLGSRDVALANGIWNIFDNNLWPELKALNDRTRGKSPPKVVAAPYETNAGKLTGGYFRLKYDTNLDERAQHFDETAAVKDLLGGSMGMSAKTAQGTSTERKQNVTMRPRLDLGVFAETVNETVHDLAFREAVADTMRLLNDTKIQNTIKTAAGTPSYRALVTRVREVAAPPRNPSGFIEKAATIARKNTVVTLMSGVRTALQNFTGFLSSASRVNPGLLTKEIARFYSPKMVEMVNFAYEHSPYMKNRHNSFERELQNAAKKMTVNGSIMPETGTWLALMGVVDRGTSIPVWHTAFKEGMGKFNNDTSRAVDYADHIIRQTQGSGRAVDAAQIMAGHGAAGQMKALFTMFYSYFNAQLGMLVRTGSVNKRLAKTNPSLAAAKFTKDFMLIVVLPAVLTEMLFKKDDPNEDPADWARKYAHALAMYGAGMFPIVRDVASYTWASFDPNEHNFGFKVTPVTSMGEGIVKGAVAIKNIATGEGEDRDLKDIIMGTSFAVGLPGNLIKDTTLGTKAWLQGEAGPGAIAIGPPRK